MASVAQLLRVSVADVLKTDSATAGAEAGDLGSAGIPGVDQSLAANAGAVAAGEASGSAGIPGVELGGSRMTELAQFRALLDIYPKGWMPRDLADMARRRQGADLSFDLNTFFGKSFLSASFA